MLPPAARTRARGLALMALYLTLAVFMLAPDTAAHAARKGDGIRDKAPELCYRCHARLKDILSQKHVHSPFREGMCDSCHDPHISNMRALMKEEINPLCLSCHNGLRDLIKKGRAHGAISKGVCTDCHNAHGGQNRHLLVTAEAELCWNCHQSLKDTVDESTAHLPFRKGQCSSCHNPHASTGKGQLVSAPNALCKKCHKPGCRADGVSISSVTGKLDCTGCHSGHGSAAGGLLGPYGHAAFLEKKCGECHNPIKAGGKITTRAGGSKLCLGCHGSEPGRFTEGDVHGKGNACTMCHTYHASTKSNLTSRGSGVCLNCHKGTGKRIATMEKALKSFKCRPVRDRECFACHLPLHSGRPLYFKAEVAEACAGCHKSQHEISHPAGTGVTDPRNGETLTCVSCHSMHSARAEFMLQFDRNRQLCIQCHRR